MGDRKPYLPTVFGRHSTTPRRRGPGEKGGERKGRPTGQELAQLSFNVLHNSQYPRPRADLSSSSRNVLRYQDLQGFLLTAFDIYIYIEIKIEISLGDSSVSGYNIN